MKYTKVWLFLSAILVTAAVFMASGVAWSQVNLGSVRGEVQDTQRAAIPGATLTLKNESTGVSQSANSGADGQYVFLNLAAGNYTLTTAASGFSTSVQQHIVVGIGSTIPISVTMQPGQVQQTVPGSPFGRWRRILLKDQMGITDAQHLDSLARERVISVASIGPDQGHTLVARQHMPAAILEGKDPHDGPDGMLASHENRSRPISGAA